MRQRGDSRFILKKIIFLLLFLTAAPLLAEKIYRVLSKGAVLDKSTNLIWTRCPLSTDDKPISDFNCTGTKKIYTWDQAKEVCEKLAYEGRTDWRLPTIRELQSIVYYHHKPTTSENYSQVVEKVFPKAVTQEDLQYDSYDFFGETVYCLHNTCYQHYWSSTNLSGHSDLMWAINFYTGVLQWDSYYEKDWGGSDLTDKPKYKSVRCVAGP